MTVALPAPLHLRPAVAEDLSQIRALVRRARLDPTQLRPAQFVVIVAGAGGEVVACGQLRRFGAVRELGSLVVAPGWRGRGLAAQIITHLLAAADGPVYLECEARLAPFYTRFGFVELPWRALPRPLKPKFGLSRLLSTLFGIKLAFMAHATALAPLP